MIFRGPGFFIWLHSPPPSSPPPSPVSKLDPGDGGDPPQVVTVQAQHYKDQRGYVVK
jgi:hypothetical protein